MGDMKLFDVDFVASLESDVDHYRRSYEEERRVNKDLYLDIAGLERDIRELDALIATSRGLRCPNPECNDKGYTEEVDGYGNTYELKCKFCWDVSDSAYNHRHDEPTEKCKSCFIVADQAYRREDK